MLKKFFARAHHEETAAADSVAPFIVRRPRSEETSSLRMERQRGEEMPVELREQWEELRTAPEKSSVEGRLRFLRKAAETLSEEYQPSQAFSHLVLITLKDAPPTPSALSPLYDLLQLCIARDCSRVCLNSDTAEIIIQCYRRALSTFQEQPSATHCDVFFYAVQGLYALGLLVLVHLGDSQGLGKVREEVTVWLQAGLMAVNSEAGLQDLAETQFAYFTEGRGISHCFLPSYPQVDLNLVLLSHLLTLAQSSSSLSSTLSAVLPLQLRALQACFSRVQPCHFLCLLDKTLLTLSFLATEMRLMKPSATQAIAENWEALSALVRSYCWTYIQQGCEQRDRLSKLFELLEQLYEGLVGSDEEQIPLHMLQAMEEWEAVEGERAGEVYAHIIEMMKRYLQHFSAARLSALMLSSGFLSVLLAPFFLLHSSSFEESALSLVLRTKEGRTLFLQEFIKGFQQHKDQIAYVSKLSRLLSELVAEERDWASLLSEQHLMDYLYQVLLETDLQPLQVCMASLLKEPRLAVSLLEQPSVLRTAVRFLGSDFGMELWARFLSCNESERAYRHFAKLMRKEQSETQVRQLYCTLETALGGQDRLKSQALFVKHSVLKVALKRLGDFPGTGLALVALPALRLLLYRCSSAQSQLRTMGFAPLKTALFTVLDWLQLPGQTAELEGLLDNLLYLLLDSTDLRTITLVKVPELADVALRAVLRLSEDAQLRYVSIIHAVCSVRVNALALSNEDAIKPALHLFSITPNTQIRSLLLGVLAAMMRESMRPRSLLTFIECLNDDSKASYPSKLTSGLLEMLKGAFDKQEKSGWLFEVQSGGSLEANAVFPRRKGGSVFVWLQLSAPPGPRLLLSLVHSQSERELFISVAPNGALTASLTGSAQSFACGLLDWTQLALVTITFSTKKAVFEVAVNGEVHECHLTEGRIPESAFNCMRIGNSEEGFEGQVACAGLFLTALSHTQLEELQSCGPAFFATFLDQEINYLSKSVRGSKLAEAELVVCMHPAYTYDPEHAVNVARSVKGLDSSRGQEGFQELQGPVHPVLRSVVAVQRTQASEALSCIGGLRVLLPLLSRVEKKHHVKEILHQLLEIAIKYCSVPSDIDSEQLIPMLRLRVESVAKRFPLKTSTAILLNHLKDALSWSKQLQQSLVHFVILNPFLWRKSKLTVRKLLISVNYSALYTSDEERVTFISRLLRFAMPDVESSSDYAADVRSIVKTYTEDGQDRFYGLLVTELLEGLVEHEGRDAMARLLLKLLVYLAKRGKVAPSDKLMWVLLHLLNGDREKHGNSTKKVLHIIKLAYCKSSTDSCFFYALLPALQQHLKMRLAPCDFQALLSLMIRVPGFSPSQSFTLPELPIKSSFSTALSNYHEVSIQHPQVMDIITPRLTHSTQQALEDLLRIVECQPQVVFDQPSFPDWTLPLLNTATAGLCRLVAVSCARALVHTQGAWKKCARVFDSLCTQQSILIPLIQAILQEVQAIAELQEKSLPASTNLRYFSYLIEDFSTLLQAQSASLDPITVFSFLQVLDKAKLLSDTQPPIPALAIGEALKCYKYESVRGRFEPREGGTMRIALTVLFQSFRSASASELAQLLPVLKLFLRPLTEKQRSALILDTKAAKLDLLSSPDFLSRLIFAELSDILITRKNEYSITSTITSLLQALNDYSGLIHPLEKLCEGLSLEDHYDVKQFLLTQGVMRLGEWTARPVQCAGWWERDGFDIAKRKLVDKVQMVLRPAFASGVLDRVLLTQDWMESVHPYCVLSSSSLLMHTTSLPQSEVSIPSAPRKLTSPLLPDLSIEIPRIAKARAQLLQNEEHDYLYQRTQWHAFKKWQAREAGLWVRSRPASPVWKLDPELDLEYKSVRLKVMDGRTQGYYQDKAHKKTLSQLSPITAKRRQSRDAIHPVTSARKAHTQTVLLTSQDHEDLLELLLTKTESCPPTTPTQNPAYIEPQLPSSRDQHECERIQAKGTSFGSLEVTSRYLIFRSAQEYKSESRDYFGSAPVPFT